MRAALLLLVLATAGDARAAPPDWTDVPALVASATAPVDKDLRACSKRTPPWGITLIASRDPKTGGTAVGMPFPNVGIRGLTPEERCLLKTVPTIQLPALPAEVEQLWLGHTVVADGATAPTADFADWKDLPAALASALDADRRAALAACAPKKRTVRIIFDLTHGKTRVWLPAWQFHSPTGDGSTPPAEKKIKACLTKAIASWKLPVLPRAMAEVDVAIPVEK